jgi:hypothetical protein
MGGVVVLRRCRTAAMMVAAGVRWLGYALVSGWDWIQRERVPRSYEATPRSEISPPYERAYILPQLASEHAIFVSGRLQCASALKEGSKTQPMPAIYRG